MKAIILAAGAGKRMNSEETQLPKVLRSALEKPLISYVLSLFDIPKRDVIIVIGFMGDKVKSLLGDEYRYALQSEQKGTGHAVSCALPELENYDGPVFIVNGDMPLLQKSTIDNIYKLYNEENASGVILAADVKEKMPYGRVVTDSAGHFVKIIEDRDCSEEEKKITFLNVGVYLFKASLLSKYLPLLSSDNSQGEYYLTDLPELMAKSGEKVCVYATKNIEEAYGVNTPDDLAEVENILKR